MSISLTPWSIKEDGDNIFIVASNNRRVAEIGCQIGEMQLCDAKYIVAAVNAVAGTPIEQLEDPDA